MNTLVINAGSTTLKFKLFDHEYNTLLGGLLENDQGEFVFKLDKDGERHKWEIGAEGFIKAPELVLKEIGNHAIDRIGFRIVHGGEKYTKPVQINDTVLEDLEKLNDLAPLHNPPALKRISEFKALLPDTEIFGVFDTAFHTTMPDKAYIYAIPYEFYEKYGVRRFGFHGTSHKYVSEIFHELEPNARKVISCHLGGGASITAIRNGKSIDTSMGFTPLEGLIMATRPGDIDDGAIHYLMDKMHMSVKDMQKIENTYSGLLGISGETSDMRTLLELEEKGHKRATLAINMYIYRIQKYIGSYAAALGGIDGLIFTAGIGQGSDVIRARIVESLEYLGLKVNSDINNDKINVSENLKISTDDSHAIWVIPTNEELQIAEEIRSL